MPHGCPWALADLFAIYQRTGRLEEGIGYFERFVREHPEQRDAPQYLAELRGAGRRLEWDALSGCDRPATKAPRASPINLPRGHLPSLPRFEVGRTGAQRLREARLEARTAVVPPDLDERSGEGTVEPLGDPAVTRGDTRGQRVAGRSWRVCSWPPARSLSARVLPRKAR